MSIIYLIIFLLALAALTFYFRLQDREKGEVKAEGKDKEQQEIPVLPEK